MPLAVGCVPEVRRIHDQERPVACWSITVGRWRRQRQQGWWRARSVSPSSPLEVSGKRSRWTDNDHLERSREVSAARWHAQGRNAGSKKYIQDRKRGPRPLDGLPGIDCVRGRIGARHSLTSMHQGKSSGSVSRRVCALSRQTLRGGRPCRLTSAQHHRSPVFLALIHANHARQSQPVSMQDIIHRMLNPVPPGEKLDFPRVSRPQRLCVPRP